MPRKGAGVPAKIGFERGDSRGAVAERTRHRNNALIANALDLILTDKDGRDAAGRLAEEFWRDPKGFIDWANRQCGPDQSSSAASVMNFGALFSLAVRAETERSNGAAVVIDGTTTAEAVRGFAGASEIAGDQTSGGPEKSHPEANAGECGASWPRSLGQPGASWPGNLGQPETTTEIEW